MHLPIYVLVKFGLFLGAVLLIGAGGFSRFVGPGLGGERAARRLAWASRAGLALIVLVGVVDIGLTVSSALGTLSPDVFWAYLSQTQHGKATGARIILAVALLVLGLETATPRADATGTLGLASSAPTPGGPREGLAERVGFVALAVAMLFSISLTSHAGGAGIGLSVALDTVHLLAMTAWVGAVAGLAWLPVWTTPVVPALAALERTSMVGLVAVLALSVTGAVAGLGRIGATEVLFGTGYGQALVVKLSLVLVVLALAGLNRFVALPRLAALAGRSAGEQDANGGRIAGFPRLLRLEALVLVAVIGATGVLTNQVPPQRGAGLASPVSFERRAGDLRLSGTFSSGALGGLRLDLRAVNAQGQPLAADAGVFAQLVMTDHAMAPQTLKRTSSAPGAFGFEGQFWMDGNWRAEIGVGREVIRIPLRAE